MIDLYALPNDFPGTDAFTGRAGSLSPRRRLGSALAEDIDDPRFMPYIQLHEFEAVLLADAGKIADVLRPVARERSHN